MEKVALLIMLATLALAQQIATSSAVTTRGLHPAAGYRLALPIEDPRSFATSFEMTHPVFVKPSPLELRHRKAGYTHGVGITISGFNRTWTLDLCMNPLVDGREERGNATVHAGQEAQYLESSFCHFHGVVRGAAGETWATASTCHGVMATFFDGDEVYSVKPLKTKAGIRHVMYLHKDVDVGHEGEHTCGVHGNHNKSDEPNFTNHFGGSETDESLHRVRRQTILTEGTARVLELIIVVDHRFYEAFDRDEGRVKSYIKTAVNQVDRSFRTINLRISLKPIIILKDEEDPFMIVEDEEKTLHNFTGYMWNLRRKKGVKFDAAQLLTGMDFVGATKGIAYIGHMCTVAATSIVQYIQGKPLEFLSLTMTHELGHNLGMRHDNNRRCDNCPEGSSCIMKAGLAGQLATPHLFSQCSVDEYHRLPRKSVHCLKEVERCGDGVVDAGEDCDCGMVAEGECKNECCDQATCKFVPDSECSDPEIGTISSRARTSNITLSWTVTSPNCQLYHITYRSKGMTAHRLTAKMRKATIRKLKSDTVYNISIACVINERRGKAKSILQKTAQRAAGSAKLTASAGPRKLTIRFAKPDFDPRQYCVMVMRLSVSGVKRLAKSLGTKCSRRPVIVMSPVEEDATFHIRGVIFNTRRMASKMAQAKAKTPAAAPSKAPDQLVVKHITQHGCTLMWKKIDTIDVNGKFQGYVIQYRADAKAEAVTHLESMEPRVEIETLYPGTEVEFSVSVASSAGVGPPAKITVDTRLASPEE